MQSQTKTPVCCPDFFEGFLAGALQEQACPVKAAEMKMYETGPETSSAKALFSCILLYILYPISRKKLLFFWQKNYCIIYGQAV
jgi:hypothetical protein